MICRCRGVSAAGKPVLDASGRVKSVGRAIMVSSGSGLIGSTFLHCIDDAANE
jgi:hypothetical protein